MQNAGIHPKFAGLPDTAKDSEVVTSQYADIAAKSGHSDDMEQIVDYMKEWDTLLTSKGLTVPNEITGVLSEQCYDMMIQIYGIWMSSRDI